MKRKEFITVVVAAAGAMFVGVGVAQVTPRDAASAQSPDQLPEGEPIYGSDLLTQQERNQYRKSMSEMKGDKQREQFRAEHHVQMQQRAKDRGVKLPDAPPTQGRGAGPQVGPGAGAGGGKGR
jgi:hypothetical protein